MHGNWLPRAIALPTLLFVAGLTGSGCSNDDDGGGSGTCATFVSKLQECGLLSAGKLACTDADYDSTRCELQCFREARCEDIQSWACGTGVANGIISCLAYCDEPSFECADARLVVPEDAKCDGYDDCWDGSDEEGCPAGTYFECEDGLHHVAMSDKCNGRQDCDDGSDELGCNTNDWFHCRDGSGELHPDYVCDTERNCEDGSDEEQGCAVLDDSCAAWYFAEILHF